MPETITSQVHPDNTALRAVDACGGTYSASEESSEYALGHRTALSEAMLAVGHVDGIAAALLTALTEARTTLLMLKRNVETEIRSHDGLFRWEGVPEAIQTRIDQCTTIITAASKSESSNV